MPHIALKAIDEVGDREDLFDFLREFYRSHGFNAICYIIPRANRPGAREIVQFGFPNEWIKKYADGLGEHDPYLPYATETGRIFRWSEIAQLRPLTDGNRAFLDELARCSEMTDGFALPTFGRHQRVGYFGIGQVQDPDVLLNCDVLKLHAIAQRAHTRLDEIAEAEQPLPSLSPREREILHWVARGKSNNDLAVILGISAATVATYLQRVFAKLDANDRVSAVVAAAKLGLIEL